MERHPLISVLSVPIRVIRALPEEWFRPVLLDYQRPYAREQQAQMAEVARQFAVQRQEQAAERPAPMVLGGGVF